MNKSYQRGTDDTDGPKNSNVAAEIRKLIASGKNDYTVLAQLKGKYQNNQDLVDAIFDGYKERLEFIQKKANKFKQLMYERYNRYNLTFPQLLKKARKYKKRYELSDDEFQVFLNNALSDKSMSGAVTLPHTAMAKTLGYGATIATTDKLNVKDNEFDILQDILKINAETRPLHANIILQSLTYTPHALQALVGSYKRDSQNAYSYVHPIVAAMFLPKVDYLDEHMLIASISDIVKLKHEGKPILTKPNYELFYDLITDPNDTVCDMSSPLNDLRNRIVLQCRLWDAVMNLRQGKYYNDKLVEFLVAIENCRNNVYDVPDLTYVKDEGAILRRLLSAFSLRPTVVNTVPIYGVISNNPHINPAAVTQVTTIPMVSLRLPLDIYRNDYMSGISLQNALLQAHWFVENKMLVPKSQSIMHSRDVLFFYVGRRFQVVNVAKHTAPYNFSALPMTVSGIEHLNSTPVECSLPIEINDEHFALRSVVVVDTTEVNQKTLITGCSTFTYTDATASATQRVYHYDPVSALNVTLNDKTQTMNYQNPITEVPLDKTLESVISTRGTIFLYQKAAKPGKMTASTGVGTDPMGDATLIN